MYMIDLSYVGCSTHEELIADMADQAGICERKKYRTSAEVEVISWLSR
jgi:hypothetical protein